MWRSYSSNGLVKTARFRSLVITGIGNPATTYTTQLLRLEALATFAPCVTPTALEYYWTEELQNLDLSKFGGNSRQLVIPANTLDPGKSYRFEVTVVDLSGINNTKAVEVECLTSSLVASIRGGTRRNQVALSRDAQRF